MLAPCSFALRICRINGCPLAPRRPSSVSVAALTAPAPVRRRVGHPKPLEQVFETASFAAFPVPVHVAHGTEPILLPGLREKPNDKAPVKSRVVRQREFSPWP